MKRILKRISYALCLSAVLQFANVNIPTVYADEALEQGRYLIENYYIESIPDSSLLKDNLKDIVKDLNDPYSSYLTSEEYSEFQNSINNTFSGIGVTIEMVSDGVKVVSVMDNSPALEAEIRAGDIIIEADNHSLAGLSSEEAVKYIRGPKGTFVNLKYVRQQTTVSKRVERRDIIMATAVGQVLDKHIGYIVLSSFGENTPVEFKTELDKLNKAGVDSFIIDLRYNPGGYTSSAFDISGYFIGNRPVLEIRTRDVEKEIYNGLDHGYTIDKPVIFLINEYSASSSEILAAAVKDYKKAIFIGEKTYGKGVAQSVFGLSDGSYLKLTVFKFYSPKGKEINKVGVKPDLEIKTGDQKSADPLLISRVLMGGSVDNIYKLGAIRAGIKNGQWKIEN
jgi:carboxyl-terminal processing protease